MEVLELVIVVATLYILLSLGDFFMAHNEHKVNEELKVESSRSELFWKRNRSTSVSVLGLVVFMYILRYFFGG